MTRVTPTIITPFPPSDANRFGPPPSDVVGTEYQTREARIGEHLLKGVPSAAIGAIDTFGQSLFLFNDDSVASTLRTYLPAIGDYYSRYKTPARTVGDLTGMFLPITYASKAFRGVKALREVSELIDTNRYARAILGTTASRDELVSMVNARDRYLAGRGAFSGLVRDTDRMRLARGARNQSMANSMREAAAAELGLVVTMNQSDLFYPDEFETSDHLALAALGIALPAGIDRLIINKQLRASIASVGGIAMEARNPGNMPLDQILSTPVNRDIALAVYSITR
jgi:hypothetical protein